MVHYDRRISRGVGIRFTVLMSVSIYSPTVHSTSVKPKGTAINNSMLTFFPLKLLTIGGAGLSTISQGLPTLRSTFHVPDLYSACAFRSLSVKS